MSRYALHHSDVFGEIVFGFDPAIGAFFVQCFKISEADDEEPATWHPSVTLSGLESVLLGCFVTLPDLVRRVLVAEQKGARVELKAGDPVLFRDDAQRMQAGRVRELSVVREQDYPNALVEHSDGALWMHTLKLEPDLLSVGVE